MILHRGRHLHACVPGYRQRLVEEFEISGEGVEPASALPGDRPAALTAPPANGLDQHARFRDRPFTHGLLAPPVLGDDRFEHDEAKAGGGVTLYLAPRERQLS